MPRAVNVPDAAQPVQQISSVHHVPRCHSWLERQWRLLQVTGATMKANSNRPYSSSCLEATKKESGWRAFRRVVRLAVAGAALWLPATLPAQQLGVDVTSAQQESGTELGNYHTNFDIEAGYRFVGTEGNASMYSTWGNMQQGPRILSSDLSMRSLNHDGFLSDRLNMSSFAYGGDPETATRLTVSKDKWYDFSFTY